MPGDVSDMVDGMAGQGAGDLVTATRLHATV
jgi:hypothetical protein